MAATERYKLPDSLRSWTAWIAERCKPLAAPGGRDARTMLRLRLLLLVALLISLSTLLLPLAFVHQQLVSTSDPSHLAALGMSAADPSSLQSIQVLSLADWSAALAAASGASSVPALKYVVIVTSELHGVVMGGGGIGTAYTSLAKSAAALNHTVSVLVVPWSEQVVLRDEWPAAQRQYESEGVDVQLLIIRKTNVTVIAGQTQQTLVSSADGCVQSCVQSWHAYRWLDAFMRQLQPKGRSLVVHVQDNSGLGYWIAVAKRQQLLSLPMTLVVGSHGPHLWERVANGFPLLDTRHLAIDFMERTAVAEADWLISPSAYMVQWMRQQGWRLPQLTAVQVNLLPRLSEHDEDEFGASAPRSTEAGKAAADRPFHELVFFGRLEVRKGLMIFLEALTSLFDTVTSLSPQQQPSQQTVSRNLLSGLVVTFLGKNTRLPDGRLASELVAAHCDWLQSSFDVPLHCRVHNNATHGEALGYMLRNATHPPLAVIASPIDNSPYTVLECLGYGIPFLAANVGGIPELLCLTDQQRQSDTCRAAANASPNLFQPEPRSLADKLLQTLQNGLPQLPLFKGNENEAVWHQWHVRLPPSTAALPPPIVMRTLVLHVCVMQPPSLAVLREVLRSIEMQEPSTRQPFTVRWSVAQVSPVRRHNTSLYSAGGGPSLVPLDVTSTAIGEALYGARQFILLPSFTAASVVSRWLWAAQQISADYVLFLDSQHALQGNHALSTLLEVAVQAGADLTGAVLYNDSRQSVSLHLGCRHFLGVLSSSNCYSSRSLLMKRSVFDVLSPASFGYQDDVFQWHTQSEAQRLTFEMVPMPLFRAVPYNSSCGGGGGNGTTVTNTSRSLISPAAALIGDTTSEWIVDLRLLSQLPSLALTTPASFVSAALLAGPALQSMHTLQQQLRSSEKALARLRLRLAREARSNARRLPPSSALSASLSASSSLPLLAQSAEEFGVKQGYRGWWYHWQRGQRGPVRELEHVSVHAATNESQWCSPAPHLSRFCTVRARTQHPCVVDGEAVSVMRSWRATVDGTVLVTGSASKGRAAACGDGSQVSLRWRNSTLFQARLMAGEQINLPSLEVSVELGDWLHVTTHPGETLSDSCDETAVRVYIRLKEEKRPLAVAHVAD